MHEMRFNNSSSWNISSSKRDRRRDIPACFYCFTPSMGAKYCDQRVCMFACLFVCLSTPLAYLTYHTFKFHQIFCTCCCGRSLVLLCNMLCISGFVDDVTFPHNEANGQNQRRCVCFVQFVRWRQRLRLHLIFVVFNSWYPYYRGYKTAKNNNMHISTSS